MSEIIDEMLEEARQVGFQMGFEHSMLENIRYMIKYRHYSAEEALKTLDIPSEEWPRYLAMLKQQAEEGANETGEIIDEMLGEARQVGFQIGYERTLLESARSIVKNLHLTAEEALKALDVPSEELPQYLAML